MLQGHLALAVVGPDRIRELNREHRGHDESTDVLSFPIDDDQGSGPRELGDVVICPQHTEDLGEATVHGVLHLCGMDHETDSGEMLDLQARVLASLAGRAQSG
ncbi:MAG: rRNA maturation RNase YbeY [Actinomycetota bacterium]|nr:rRNA maturation RNase YbeY [Actinomycetota bacterium]MDQ3648337.1 rRNA maturation RNase YbeY [Actinomycetota bacterium]